MLKAQALQNASGFHRERDWNKWFNRVNLEDVTVGEMGEAGKSKCLRGS